ncbi:hypothetical protein P8452_36049 [Trifolium repens]|nr:hypothetical protein QL285_067420 [Trifolium repens]WJX49643.1 hypothetical protein P8452_36049 [Trifolium repens]
MTSKKFSLIWILLFLFMLSFSTKAIAISDAKCQNRKQLKPEVPRNNRGRIPLELNDEVNEVRGPTEKAANAPRCHNYR